MTTKDENQMFHDQIFNLLGKEKVGIIAMTFDLESLKVIYKNDQMSLFENQTLQPMIVGETYERSDMF